VTLLPAVSVPDDGDTVIDPSRLVGSAIDQETGPPLAVSVSDAPSSGLSTSADGDTDSVPVLDDALSDVVPSGTVAVATPETETERLGADASLAVVSLAVAMGAVASAATAPLGAAVDVVAVGFTETDRRCFMALPGAVDQPAGL
jgi:hypothetical protein